MLHLHLLWMGLMLTVHALPIVKQDVAGLSNGRESMSLSETSFAIEDHQSALIKRKDTTGWGGASAAETMDRAANFQVRQTKEPNIPTRLETYLDQLGRAERMLAELQETERENLALESMKRDAIVPVVISA